MLHILKTENLDILRQKPTIGAQLLLNSVKSFEQNYNNKLLGKASHIKYFDQTCLIIQ